MATNTHQSDEISRESPLLNTTDFDDDFTKVSLESSHPLYLHPSDNPGQILVSVVLNGDNFNEWKRSMSLALSAKSKLGIVTGKYKILGIDSPYFDS